MEVNIKINAKCQLVATPIDNLQIEQLLSPYTSTEDAVVYLEFLINSDIDNNKTIKVSKGDEYYCYDLPIDGLYVYHKLKIFDRSYVDKDYVGLCFDCKTNQLFFKTKPLKDIKDILPYLDMADFGVLDYIKAPVFSICKLHNCLKELQKKSIIQCNKEFCADFNIDRKMIDFLFVSIYVIEHLIEQEKYGEAIDILKALTSCTPICNNVLLNKPGCNCK